MKKELNGGVLGRFDMHNKVVGHSSTSFGGGVGGLAGRLWALIFGHARRINADSFIRKWGTAYFTYQKCGCNIEIDISRFNNLPFSQKRL